MERSSWYYIKEIQKNSDAYRSDYNAKISKKAEFIRNTTLRDDFFRQATSERNFTQFVKNVV
jgi:hypothetical protein